MLIFLRSLLILCNFNWPVLFGDMASICFFLVYIPQFLLNYKRKSVEGFSKSSVILKLIGSAFLCVNSLFNGSQFPIFLYGFLNTIEHSVFLIQFAIFGKQYFSLIYILFPIIPYLICIFFPSFIPYTDLIKPITQFVGHIPQLISCIKIGSTKGISILGEHLHYFGSILGFLMLLMTRNFNISKWVLYGNTFIQALSVYIVASCFGELRITDQINSTNENDNVPLLENACIDLNPL